MAKRIKGFTLVEVMVSTVIVTMIVGAILGFFSHYLGSTRRVAHHLMAIKLARQTMEQAHWDLAPVSEDRPIPAGAMGNAANPTRNITVVPGNRYRTVVVTVGWE